MLLFCGSSSILQFPLRNGGSIGRFSFLGSSILGLANEKSTTGHGPIVKGLAHLPGEKLFVLMFGNVDLDFTYYRESCLSGVTDIDAHFTRCISAYNSFLESLLEEAARGGYPIRVCVLAPQLSPLRDSVFAEVTAKHARVPEDAVRALGEKMDISHRARLSRTQAFNTRLEREILPHDLIRVFRIDQDMLDADGALHERFHNPNMRDHHANGHETLKCWRAVLSNDVPIFRSFRPNAPQDADLAAVG